MRNISFDISSIAVLILLLISVLIKKSTIGKTNRIFLMAIVVSMASTCFDIMAVVFDGIGASHFQLMFSHTGYLMLHNFEAVAHVIFVISAMDLWHKLKKNIPLQIWIALPYLTAFVLLVTNPATELVFTVDNGGYTHGPLFFMLYICAGSYLLVDIYIVIKNRILLSKLKVIGLMSMTGICLLAVIIHMILPDQLVECFGVSLSLFIVSLAIQRPEERYDSDTGLYRQSAYAHDMKNSYLSGKRWNVVMLNIANQSSVHSMLGYEQSLGVLKIVSDKICSLNKNLGNRGEIYHLDRGRFRIVFLEKDRTIAETYATLLNNELKMKIHYNSFDINLSPMIVLAKCPEEIESFKSLMAFGLDFHKKNPFTGRVIQAPEIYHQDDFEIKNNINKIIDNALENRSFQVYYQPIYSIAEKKFVSAEALLRLFDKEHGFISPEILIPAAEKSGAIHKIGEYVFEEVCKFVSSEEFEALGLDYIEVNLSVAQCMHGDLADRILMIMEQYNVPASRINLEITETAASFSQRVMTENLNKLSRAGVEFSLDDFGTGYSNMKRVVSLPLKIVKLDKSFVDEQANPKMWIFLQNTVKMLKDMNMEIVVEGIETKEMVQAFSELKCDFIQGYYFSKAISKDDFVKFILAAIKKKELV